MKKMFNMPQITGGGSEICTPRVPNLHEIKISASGGDGWSEANSVKRKPKWRQHKRSYDRLELLANFKTATPQNAFTLAEVLITLAIIGVVAALTIPSVIANTQQQEFKTGLKKAVSVLNSAITMNMALEGESPYDNGNLFTYLQRHMSVMKSGEIEFASTAGVWVDKETGDTNSARYANAAFYTTDGMRFEFAKTGGMRLPLHETKEVKACVGALYKEYTFDNPEESICGPCGSYGLKNNPDNTATPPCVITVDVNGDRKPTPYNANCKVGKNSACANKNKYWVADPNGKRIYDVFSIMVTDKQAIPYGIAAQKAMYNTQK